MMRQMDYSVIIPVWNTPEGYLRACIDSVRTNTDCTFEILVIDDGSRKDCAGTIDVLAEEDDRIQVFHRPHRGVSAARNFGAGKAEGEYGLFLDADDELVPGILDRLLPLCRKAAPDLLLTRIKRGEEGTPERASLDNCDDNKEDLKNRLRRYYITLQDRDFRDGKTWINRAPHGRIVRRDLFQYTLMPEDLAFGEDVIWNFDLLKKADHITILSCVSYQYNRNAFSATQSYRPDFPAEVRALLERYDREIRSWDMDDRQLLYEAATMEYFSILMRIYVLGKEENVRERYRIIVNDPFWKNIFRQIHLPGVYGRKRDLLIAALGKVRAFGMVLRIFAYFHHK